MWFPIMFNSFIHVLLYYYYLLSIVNNKQKIWWAKYLTRLQLIQFICIITQQYLSITSDKYYPYYIREFHILYGLYMIYLFGQFYVKKYNIKKIEE
jgi:elongation of very long chain fatty acids protein 4